MDALRLFEAHKIDDLIVVDARPAGRADRRPPQIEDRVKTPIRIGIIGMGGFAGSHHHTVARLEERGHARLICTCDPHAASLSAEQQTWKFAARGVQVFTTIARCSTPVTASSTWW